MVEPPAPLRGLRSADDRLWDDGSWAQIKWRFPGKIGDDLGRKHDMLNPFCKKTWAQELDFEAAEVTFAEPRPTAVIVVAV